MPSNVNNVFQWMKQQEIYYRCGEFSTATELAERAADHFRMWEALDDPNHWIWDNAAHALDCFDPDRVH